MHLQCTIWRIIQIQLQVFARPSHEDPPVPRESTDTATPSTETRRTTLRTKTDKVAHTSTKPQTGSSQVHKTTISREFQTVSKTVWQLFPKTSTSVQVQFQLQLHEQQFQNSWQQTEQQHIMILSCWDISCDKLSSQSHDSYIIGSYEYLSTKRQTTKTKNRNRTSCRKVPMSPQMSN